MPRTSKKAADTENTVVTPEADAPVKKTAARKTAAKKPEVKEAEVKAAEVKEAAPKKTAAKKTAAKKAEPEITVTIQFNGKDMVAADIVEKAKAAFVQISPDVQISAMDIYVKPEEGVAYYAVNGEGSGDYKVEL